MKTKLCTQCKNFKPINNFNKNKGKKDGLQSYCRACQKLLKRKHYDNNRQYYIDKAKQWEQDRREWFHELKSTMCCEKCGESHPATLDFHHNGDKDDNISNGISHSGWGRQRILKEIAKCNVLCANCHRKLHYDERRI